MTCKTCGAVSVNMSDGSTLPAMRETARPGLFRCRACGAEKEIPLQPQKGMGATYGFNGDYYPATIIDVSSSGHRIVLRDDEAHVISGSAFDGTAVWAINPNPQGTEYIATRRKDGSYRLMGQGGFRVTIGRRHRAWNPSF